MLEGLALAAPLVVTEDQEALRVSARELLRRSFPPGRFRRLRDAAGGVCAAGVFDADLDRAVAEAGWTGIVVPEEAGGAGLTLAEVATVLGEVGAALAPTALVSGVGAAVLLQAAGHGAGLERLVAGEVVAVAWPDRLGTVRERGGRLAGRSVQVEDAGRAGLLVVVGDDQASLVEAVDLPEGAVRPVARLDNRDVAAVTWEGVPAERLVIEGGALARARDSATVALCAEALGHTEAVFHMTLQWLKTRRQFDVPIGSFQALQHRAAALYVRLEQMRSAVLGASRARPDGLGALASMAKVLCSEGLLLAAEEGVQLHGGIGMTDEHDVGFFLKRARVCQQVYGAPAWHLDRWASLRGY